MPELPEVETVRKTLKNLINNQIINEANVYWDNIVEYPSVKEFENTIRGQKIVDIKRKGKWLLFELTDYYLMSHLRMEGKYFVKDENIKSKHDHVIFKLDNKYLIYNDTRKFGKMHLIKKEELNAYKPIKELGDEPFDIDFLTLKEKLKNKKIPIKTALLDQKIMAGLGNIYVNEVLFLCKINPARPSDEVSDSEIKSIIYNSIFVLEKAMKQGGTTIRSYTSQLGVTGRFQNELLVHTKENEPCPVCKTKLKKEFINGRSTYYCSNCQK